MRITDAKLELHFSDHKYPELIKTVFHNHITGTKIIGLRSIGVLPRGTVSFKWTPCSKATALFFVKAKMILSLDSAPIPILEGYSLTPATCLGARLWKRDSAWIHDVFGSDKDGNPILRKLLIGINLRQKTKAPVQLYLKTSMMPTEGIYIFLDGVNISNNMLALKKLSARLLEQWSPGSNGKSYLDDSSEVEKLVA